MSETGFLAQKPRSPAGLVIVIALHGVALTALALSKMPVERYVPEALKIRHIPNPEPPPPNPEPPPEAPKARESIETVKPFVPVPPQASDYVVIDLPTLPPAQFGTPSGTGTGPIPQPRPLPPDPVRVEARMSSASVLQPPYPASEQRLDREGSVTIRLVIGADGRVKAAEKVRATSDAFYRATERHALRHWRFHPATLDGRPVESSRTVTVDFVLDA